jgi:hypothetical protein
VSGDFSVNMPVSGFIQMMTQSGVPVSKWDSGNNPFHKGVQLRSSKSVCGLHVTINPGSGTNGAPTTGNWHVDLINPVNLQDTSQLNPLMALLHGAVDVLPDIAQENNPDPFLTVPTGNMACPH